MEQELKIQIEDLESELEDIKNCQGIYGKKYKIITSKDNDIKTITKKYSNNKNNSLMKKLKNENEHLRKLVVTYKLKNRKYEISADKSLKKKSLYNLNNNFTRTLKNIRAKTGSNLDAFPEKDFNILDPINYINTINNTMVYANTNVNNEISVNLSRTKLYNKNNNNSNAKIKNLETKFKKISYDSNIQRTKNLSNTFDHKTIFINNTNKLPNIKKLYFSNSNPKVVLTSNKSLKSMKLISKKNTTLNPTIENSESNMKNYIINRYKKLNSKKNNQSIKDNEVKHNTLVMSPNATFSNINSNNINNISNIIYNKIREFPNLLRNNIHSFKKLPFHSKKIESKRQLSSKKIRDINSNNSFSEKNNFNSLLSCGNQNKKSGICNNIINKQKLINKCKTKIDENSFNDNNLNKENTVKCVKKSNLLSASNINSFDNENKNFLNFKDSKYNTANKENKNSENNIHFKKKIIKNNSIVNKLNILNSSNKILLKNENSIFLGK